MKLNCFILRTTAVAGLGVPIFRVITVDLILTLLYSEWPKHNGVLAILSAKDLQSYPLHRSKKELKQHCFLVSRGVY